MNRKEKLKLAAEVAEEMIQQAQSGKIPIEELMARSHCALVNILSEDGPLTMRDHAMDAVRRLGKARRAKNN